MFVLIWLSFVLTLADWFSALCRGQAVTLLPEALYPVGIARKLPKIIED